jgi:hypothetical protein
MSQTQEGQDLDLNEAEVGDFEDPDVLEGGEEPEEVSGDPFNQTSGEQGPMEQEPMMDDQPPLEDPDTLEQPPMEQEQEQLPSQAPYIPPQQQSSFIDNEFKTINTGSQARQSQDDGVLFPDAPESHPRRTRYP